MFHPTRQVFFLNNIYIYIYRRRLHFRTRTKSILILTHRCRFLIRYFHVSRRTRSFLFRFIYFARSRLCVYPYRFKCLLNYMHRIYGGFLISDASRFSSPRTTHTYKTSIRRESHMQFSRRSCNFVGFFLRNCALMRFIIMLGRGVPLRP